MDKILSFIINEKNELLILKGSPDDPQLKKSIWYVVTGACEKVDIDFFDTVKREIFEETNLEVKDMLYLNWIFKYESLGENCIERVYISKIKSGEIILNEESIDYKWCDFNEFIELIDWFGYKETLSKVLKEALNFKSYFVEEKIDIC